MTKLIHVSYNVHFLNKVFGLLLCLVFMSYFRIFEWYIFLVATKRRVILFRAVIKTPAHRNECYRNSANSIQYILFVLKLYTFFYVYILRDAKTPTKKKCNMNEVSRMYVSFRFVDMSYF